MKLKEKQHKSWICPAKHHCQLLCKTEHTHHWCNPLLSIVTLFGILLCRVQSGRLNLCRGELHAWLLVAMTEDRVWMQY